jgi:hypothetical protein
MSSLEKIKKDFTYHAPKGNQQERYMKIREKAYELAVLLHENTPESNEKKSCFYLFENFNYVGECFYCY